MKHKEKVELVEKYCVRRDSCRGCVLNDAELECEPLGDDLDLAVKLIEEERDDQ